MNFCYIAKCRNNRKMKKLNLFFKIWNFFISPSNEILLHRIEWKNAQVQLISFSYMHADRWTNRQTDGRTYIYPALDKRYSPIISTICELINDKIFIWKMCFKITLLVTSSVQKYRCFVLMSHSRMKHRFTVWILSLDVIPLFPSTLLSERLRLSA